MLYRIVSFALRWHSIRIFTHRRGVRFPAFPPLKGAYRLSSCSTFFFFSLRFVFFWLLHRQTVYFVCSFCLLFSFLGLFSSLLSPLHFPTFNIQTFPLFFLLKFLSFPSLGLFFCSTLFPLLSFSIIYPCLLPLLSPPLPLPSMIISSTCG